MGKTRKNKCQGELGPHMSLWEIQHLGAIRAEQDNLMGLHKTFYLVVHNKYPTPQEVVKAQKELQNRFPAWSKKLFQ